MLNLKFAKTMNVIESETVGPTQDAASKPESFSLLTDFELTLIAGGADPINLS